MLKELLARCATLGEKLAFLGPLLLRISLGLMFAQAGWGKLENMERTVSFFESLTIPAPHFHAHLVAWTETIGGSFLLLGLLVRLSSLPLFVTMLVALITSALPETDGLLEALSLNEILYAAALTGFILQGGGKASFDELLARYYPNFTLSSSAAPS